MSFGTGDQREAQRFAENYQNQFHNESSENQVDDFSWLKDGGVVSAIIDQDVNLFKSLLQSRRKNGYEIKNLLCVYEYEALIHHGPVSMIEKFFMTFKDIFPGSINEFLTTPLDDDCRISILTLAVSFGKVENLKKVLELLENDLPRDLLRDCLRDTKEWRERNLLTEALAKNNQIDSIKHLWTYIEGNFSREELREILHEKDFWGNNFIHIAAVHAHSEEIFDFIWIKVENFFDDAEEFKKYLMTKGPSDYSILGLAKSYKNEKTFNFIINKFSTMGIKYSDSVKYELSLE